MKKSQQKLKATVDFLRTNPETVDCWKFNLFSEHIEYNRLPPWCSHASIGKPIQDVDLAYIRYYISTMLGIEPSKDIVADACLMVAKDNPYHPVKNFIEKEKWDCVNRIDSWLIKTMGCVNNEYTRSLSAKILIAAVNRVYNPGCKFDHMMILEGAQGLGKSTVIEELAGDFYLDTNFHNKDKDLVSSMKSAFIVEISELSGMNKREVEWLKSFITRKVDHVRMPYARYSAGYARNCIMIGTFNPSGDNEYLKDDTGNRRFYPVECKKISIDYVRDNRNQLWAEALHRQRQGELYHIHEKEALNILQGMHAVRQSKSAYYYEIVNFLNSSEMERLTIKNILAGVMDEYYFKRKGQHEIMSLQQEVGKILKAQGWEKGTNKDRQYYRNPNYKPVVGWED